MYPSPVPRQPWPFSFISLRRLLPLGLLGLVTAACGQTPSDPFSNRIEPEEGTVILRAVEFATVPNQGNEAARMMLMVDEPGTSRLFVNDMTGPLYRVNYDGSGLALYVDINDPRWGVGVQSDGRERGVQSFAFHPDFGRRGAPGYGRFYTYSDVRDTNPPADFRPVGGGNTHDTVLHEWVARNPAANTYDGAPPRELMRFEQPFPNHNAGHLAFHSLSRPGDPEYGLLYMGVADGGSGGDPFRMAQNLQSAFGKIFRIDPLGSNSANGKYGIPSDNPYVGEGNAGALPEIYALGVRNPQRFAWDPANGNLFLSDIGQTVVEKVSLVPKGGNLGWNVWEGSYRFLTQPGSPEADPRG